MHFSCQNNQLFCLHCAGVLLSLVSLEQNPGSSEDMATKCRRALKAVVPKLTCLPALDALVHQQLPESVIKLVLEQVGATGWGC